MLKEVDTGILDAPAVQVQNDDGVWRHENEFPPADVAWHRFGMSPDMLLHGEAGSGEVSFYQPDSTAQNSPAFGLPVAMVGQNEQVLFRSEPLGMNWTVSGLPVFHANVTTTAQRGTLVLSLAEETPEGTLRTFNYAAQSLNHARDLSNGATDISNVRQEVEVQFFPQDDVAHAGNRLVLIASYNTVSNGNPGPGLIPLTDSGMTTIELDGAWLDLPVDHSLVFEDPQPYLNA
jgi:X-Pro dipeptidyl-peptidase